MVAVSTVQPFFRPGERDRPGRLVRTEDWNRVRLRLTSRKDKVEPHLLSRGRIPPQLSQLRSFPAGDVAVFVSPILSIRQTLCPFIRIVYHPL